MKRNAFLCFFCTFYVLYIHANLSPIDSIAKKESLKEFHISSIKKGEFNSKYIAENYKNPKVDSIISKAKSIFNKLENGGNLVNELEADDMITLPVGVKKRIGETTVIMGVSEAKFYPNYTEVTLFLKLLLPQTGADGKQLELFFGADNVKISHKGGIYGDADIALLGDFPIPLGGEKTLLELKGGFDMKTGSIAKKTYVTIDCSGVKEIGIAADVLFSRTLIQPLSKDYKLITDEKVKVKGSFEAKASDWNDIIAEVNLSHPFQLTKEKKNQRGGDEKGKAGLIFEVNNAVFDFSDLKNSQKMKFTNSYREKYLIPGNEDLWRGLYIERVNVILPEEFDKRSSNNRISFGAENLLIDGEGITGQIYGRNLLSIEEGVASGWPISVKDLDVSFEASKFLKAEFNGYVVLPISGKVTKEDIKNETEGKIKGIKKAIKYDAIIDVANDEYSLALEPIAKEGLSIPLFVATANLKSNSRVELKVVKGKFRPKANLYGNLTIKGGSSGAATEGKKSLISFKGVSFENLQIQTEAPYFSVDKMGYDGESNFSNFPVTISEIGIVSNEKKASIMFKLDVNLMSKGFAGGTKLEIEGKFKEKGELQSWEFEKVNLHKINVEANLGAVKFKGLVDIKDNDPVYGNGFYGELEADFNSINVKATAWFGKTDVRYWYVDAYADLSAMATKPRIGPLEINGFGGGAYYHMKKTSNAPKLVYQGEVDENGAPISIKTPKPPSGMDYVPDAKSGLGFRAMLGFAIGNETAFNGKIGFEMAFNTSGGLNRILFFGEAHIMKAIDFKFGDKFKEKLTKMQDKINDFADNNQIIQKLKETNLVEYSKVAFPQDGLTFDVGMDAHFSMEMDFVNKAFHAELEVYLNTPGGFVKGLGPRGRAGRAVFHTGPDGWYFHLGNPVPYDTQANRIGIKVGVGGFSAKASTYFMIGDKIPGSPPPPKKVADMLGIKDLSKLDYMRELNALGDGRGFAIGMDLEVDTGDMNFLMFYARFMAGVGFDIMIKDYGKTACKGSGQIGINGWYTNGQAYAYLAGELGIKIDLWFYSAKVPIIKAGAAVLLQAKLPNPSWFRGYVGGYFDVLGIIKGKFRFKIELGEECEIIGGAPLGGLKIISGVTPDDNSKDVDVFTAPQAAFNMQINKSFKLEDDEGVKTYRILLDEFSVKKDGRKIEGELEWSNTKDVVNFISYDVLPPKSTLKTKVVVSFQELKSRGTWVTIMDKGKKAREIEERTFTTGVAPDYIPLKNVLYTYPMIDQSYFYQKESASGYVKLKQGQPYLFESENGATQKVKYTNTEGFLATNNVSYNKADRQVNFTFSKLNKTKEYTLKLISIPPGQENAENNVTYTNVNTGEEGNTVEVKNKEVQNVVNNDSETEIFKYNFTTSKYNTLADKIRDKDIVQHYLVPHFSDTHYIETDYKDSERFSGEEIEGAKYSGNNPLIVVEAVLDDSYYEDKIHKLVYENYPREPEFTVDRNINEFGLPPKKAVEALSWYASNLIEKPNYSLLSKRIPYRYNLVWYYKHDFVQIRYKIINKYLNQPTKYSSQIRKYNHIINGVFPAIKSGNYKVKMQYVMPGNVLGSSRIFKYKNPF